MPEERLQVAVSGLQQAVHNFVEAVLAEIQKK